ncbi:MAG TPA: cation-transporting P-type ATPase, partial [Candidatus Paceibacterota bacterium]
MRISEKELDQPYWALSPEEIFEILETSPEGLTEGEAENRLKEFGRNVLPKGKRATKLKIFLNQFKSPLILILLIAGVVTLVIQDFKGSAVIFAALLVNAALGFYQENKAETALRTLRTYIKERARIIRDGKEKEIDAEELAPGDQIRLFAGLRVPADARVYKVNNFLVDEAILTGESLPVQKSTEKVSLETVLADRSSMVWGGTLVSEGVGIAVVVGTGGETELGRVAALVGQEEAEKTPLQLAITRFSIRA